MNVQTTLALLLCATLAACATPQKEYVTKTQTKYLDIPESLFVKCGVTPPPTREEYMKMSLQQREEALTKLTKDLYKDLKNCNGAIEAIHAYQVRQQQIVKDAEKVK